MSPSSWGSLSLHQVHWVPPGKLPRPRPQLTSFLSLDGIITVASFLMPSITKKEQSSLAHRVPQAPALSLPMEVLACQHQTATAALTHRPLPTPCTLHVRHKPGG